MTKINEHGCTTEPEHVHTQPLELCQLKEKVEKKIYIDDLSELEVVDLKKTLLKMDPAFIAPLNFHERCGLVLPPDNAILQHKLADIQEFTQRNMMMVNKKKTMVMPFNFTHNYDLIPWLNFPGEEPLKIIYDTKLLVVNIRSVLTFSCYRGYQKNH
jgi:hypothetical protein